MENEQHFNSKTEGSAIGDLLDLINNMEKKNFREEIILEEVKKRLVNSVWPSEDHLEGAEYSWLEGKMVRYRYVDWEHDSFTPWAPCTIRDLKKFTDKSIDIIQFKP